jgi:hypothetical protein
MTDRAEGLRQELLRQEEDWREQVMQAQESGEAAVREMEAAKEQEMSELRFRLGIDLAKAAEEAERCVPYK